MIKTGPWNLTDLESIPKNGLKVFSCFHCGGGSTMGYKLAGYDVLGGVEIDPKLMKVYKTNHNPKHSYLMGVQEFKNIPDNDIPQELFNLDILDGSPPCSSFSMSGARERLWGKSHKFREGQTKQVLDDLFFDFIDIAEKLKPKIVVAENVKGLILGKAKSYVKEIFNRFDQAGYNCQLFLLNSCLMGTPQIRERTFFIAISKELSFKKINLKFSEDIISCDKAFEGIVNIKDYKKESDIKKKYWDITEKGKSFQTKHPKGHYFNCVKLHPNKPSNTLMAKCCLYHWDEPRVISEQEAIRLQTFPDDFNSCGESMHYICGMSVPPFMMQRIALEIKKQFFERKI